MNKLALPLKITSPTNKKPQSIKNINFHSLDVNGRSYSPQNFQESPYSNDYEHYDHTFQVNYDSKKFKVRSPSNFIKTAQNWRNLPYQRIRNVQNAIEISKRKQKLVMSDRGATILPQFQHFQPSTSPKTTQKRLRIQEKLKIQNRLEIRRLKQIQQVIRNSKQEQKKNIIKYQEKIKNLQSKEFVNFFSNKNNDIQSPYNLKDKQDDLKIFNKGTIYAFMVKNRRKLSQRRHTKKKSVDYSLLGRINNLQQQQENMFLLRNSIDKVKFNQD